MDFRGERRSNDTHQSTTDPEARLSRKGEGKEAKLCFGAHVLMDKTPHVAQKQRSANDRRTTRHDGYRLSQRARKRVEEVFGRVKTVGGGRKLRYCGVERNRLWMEMTTASYNLVRLSKLTPVSV